MFTTPPTLQDSPCLNDALCLVEGEGYRCYCVPDYHGPHCQYRSALHSTLPATVVL